MFLGEYQHSLDGKGRIILPSKFRARLAEGCVLTKGQDKCLYVYPPEEWERVSARMSEVRVSSQRGRQVARIFFAGASEQEPDRQGRVNVPEPLRLYAGLHPGGEATVVGAGPRCEIWERARWEEYRTSVEATFADLTEVDPDLPL